MTPQEIFDFVAVKLLQQEARSVNEDEQCVYRGRNGNKCAVGHLIPDDMYQPWMDDERLPLPSGKTRRGGTIVALLETDPSSFPWYFDRHCNLLGRLQAAHDRQINWDDGRHEMRDELSFIARDYKLDAAVLEKTKAYGEA